MVNCTTKKKNLVFYQNPITCFPFKMTLPDNTNPSFHWPLQPPPFSWSNQFPMDKIKSVNIFALISCFTWNYVRLWKKNGLRMSFHIDLNGFTPVPISSALKNNKMVLLTKYNISTCNPNAKSHCHGSEWLIWVSFF